jgi:hypothetical protein
MNTSTTDEAALFLMIVGLVVLICPRALSIIVGILMLLEGLAHFYPKIAPQ